jgi:hypothetical protein
MSLELSANEEQSFNHQFLAALARRCFARQDELARMIGNIPISDSLLCARHGAWSMALGHDVGMLTTVHGHGIAWTTHAEIEREFAAARVDAIDVIVSWRH